MLSECIQLYNNLTGQKILTKFEIVTDQIVTPGLHNSKFTGEEILVMREQLSLWIHLWKYSVTSSLRTTIIRILYSEKEQLHCFVSEWTDNHCLQLHYSNKSTENALFLEESMIDHTCVLIIVENVVGLKRVLQVRKLFDVTMFKEKCVLIDLPQHAILYACIPPRYSVED